RQKYVALTARYLHDSLMTVARPILQRAGSKAKADAASSAAKTASQEAASRNEPKGAAATPIPRTDTTGVGKLGDFRKEYLSRYKEMPDDRTEVNFLTGKYKWGQPA